MVWDRLEGCPSAKKLPERWFRPIKWNTKTGVQIEHNELIFRDVFDHGFGVSSTIWGGDGGVMRCDGNRRIDPYRPQRRASYSNTQNDPDRAAERPIA